MGMVGAAASFALLGAAHATWLLVIGGFLAGGFIDFYRPATGALVHDLVDADDRPRAYGLLFWAVNLGFAAGATMAGALAERGYGLLFAIDAATCLACAAIVWRFVPPATAPAVDHDEPGRLRDVLADRVMVAFCATRIYASARLRSRSGFNRYLNSIAFSKDFRVNRRHNIAPLRQTPAK